jgi:hypothetical protein
VYVVIDDQPCGPFRLLPDRADAHGLCRFVPYGSGNSDKLVEQMDLSYPCQNACSLILPTHSITQRA